MAVANIKSKVRKPNIVKRSKDRVYTGSSSGGIPITIGYTKSIADSADLDTIEKNLFGFSGIDFEGVSPHKQTVLMGDIRDSRGISILNPVYDFKTLIKLSVSNTMIPQAIDAYVTNIEGYGSRLEYIGPEGAAESRASLNERRRLERLLNNLTSDGAPLQAHRERSRRDKELLGGRCFEIITDAIGRVVGFDHVEASTIRLTTKEKEYTIVNVIDPVSGATKQVKRRFRRFVQIKDDGSRVWFKEWGDPRKIDPSTGEVNNALPVEEEATSIYYDHLYWPGTPYGVPRWVGVIPAILGSREAEMVNLDFFKDNAIPALAVLVSGGALTEESFNKIEQYLTGVRGRHSMNRIVVLEAVSEGAEAAAIDGSLPAPKVDIKPMLSERQHEGLFASYIKEMERKVRSAFRLPPIYVGSAEEYNRASAFASMLIAMQQIFTPEQHAWDRMFKKVVLESHGFRFWSVRSNSAGIEDPAEAARIINSVGREGALSPNAAINIANRFLDMDMETVTEEWGNLPFSVILEYIRDGKVIKGLDIFENMVENNIPGTPEEDVEAERDNITNIQKITRRILDRVSDKLSYQLEERLQSLVAE